jgi:surface glycoprotein (TIGR04207 family)
MSASKPRALALAALLVLSVVGAGVAGAAQAHGINTDSEAHTPIYGYSTSETISAHDMSEMNSPLELYDDEGEVHELNGTYNDSQAAPFGVRWDKVETDAYTQFPRTSDESENGATWTDAGQWSSTTSADASHSVTDADADGVQKVELSASSMANGETTTFNFSENVSLADPNKRVLMAVLNVDTLDGATVELRAVDGDGDYRYMEINSSRNASNETVIANKTGNGFVAQEKVGNLPLAGSGDGSLDSIQKLEVVVLDGNATVTLAGLDADRKSTIEFGTIQRDTDDDGENETVRFEDYWEGGESRLTEYDFGEQFDTATIHDWTVYEVRYPLSMLSSGEVVAEFANSSESSYAAELAKTGDVIVPSFIDLTHGTLSLRVEQGLITDKYGTLRTAQVDSSTDFGNVSDGDWTDRTGSLTEKGDEVVLISGISADQQYRVDGLFYLNSEDKDSLMASQAMSMGPTGDSGGFFSNTLNVILTLIGSAAGALGLSRLFAGG